MNPRLRMVCTVHGWDIVLRQFEGRPTDWLATPHSHVEGPVLVFPTFARAHAHAERYEAHSDSSGR